MNDLVKRTDGNVREDRVVHSRMVISDTEDLLVSSADLTREQLVEEFNAGIYTRDEDSIDAAIESFETMWKEAEPRGVR